MVNPPSLWSTGGFRFALTRRTFLLEMERLWIPIGEYRLQVKEASGKALRWAVGSPIGMRSGTWRLWGNKKGDAYLSMRTTGGLFKASFHRDGNCQMGFTSEYADTARARFGNGERHWMRWQLPVEPMVRAMQIVVPASELRAFESEDRQMHWIAAPSVGSAVTVSLFISDPVVTELWPASSEGSSPLGIMQLSERLIWVVYKEHPISPEMAIFFEECRAKVAGIEGSADARKGSDTRAVVFGHSEKKHDQFILELAWG